MATRIQLKHKEMGIIKDGYYGYSWTTLFFAFFPALFRGDFLTFVGGFIIVAILAIPTLGLSYGFSALIWSFFYNSYYTKKLLERGYIFDGSDDENLYASNALGIKLKNSISENLEHKTTTKFFDMKNMEKNHWSKERNLSNDEYIVFLVKKYGIQKNDVLNKIIAADKLFENIDAALSAVNDIDINEFENYEKIKSSNEVVIDKGKIGGGAYGFIKFGDGSVEATHQNGIKIKFKSIDDAIKNLGN